MVARESIEQFRRDSSQLSALVAKELADYFGVLDLSRPEAARDALIEFVPLLVAEYGDVTAALAVEWYEELQLESGDSTAYGAILPPAPSVSLEQVEAKVRFLAGQLWTPKPAGMLGSLTIATDKYVKQPGRDVITWNAKREGARYARVPSGAKTCAFCLVLASRDAIYLSKRSAGDSEGTGFGDDFHGDCDCAVVRIGKAEDYPVGYLSDDYYDIYRDAVDKASSPETQAFLESLGPDAKNKQLKGVVFALRNHFQDLVTDGVHPTAA